MKRGAGILLPITSLPSNYGIGTMGQSARDFIDFLKKSGQRYWQILPIGQTGYGDSPYQSFSAFAGNPYWIDLDDLCEEGLLQDDEFKNEIWFETENKVDYGRIYELRYQVLKKACDRLTDVFETEFEEFLKQEQHWLLDYALFMAIKNQQGGAPVSKWPEDLRLRKQDALDICIEELQDDILFYEQIQFLFFKQWKQLKDYANENGILLIGDVPIYVSEDSVDLWSHPDQFQLDEDYKPIEVAGCPPDGFSKDGQLWGNPLFDWDEMKKDNYQWWKNRVAHQMRFVDVLRIDHFRGFESYYAIPYGSINARVGRWRKGPGIELFRELEASLGKLNIIAEDLGFLTDDVIQMVKETGYPGMKVLQFAFDSRDTGSGYLPHTYDPNCIVYAGTHDNDTVIGWMESAPKDNVEMAIEYLHLDEIEGYNWGMIRGAYSSVASIAIMQMQDFLGLGSEGRINIPSTCSKNWVWRMKQSDMSDELALKIYRMTSLYGRIDHDFEMKEVDDHVNS